MDWLNYKVKSIRDEEDEYIRRRCLGKKAYSTSVEAQEDVIKMKSRYGHLGYEFDFYYCEICDSSHVGRKNNRHD